MFNKISLGKVASIGLVTSLSLAFSVNNAKALDFSFSGISTSSLSASGTFRIDDAAIPSSSLNQTDLLDWKIDIFDGANTTTLFGIGGGLGGAQNSSIAFFPTGLSVNNSTLDFSTITADSLCITEDGNCTSLQGLFGATATNIILANSDIGVSEFSSTSLTANAVSSTPVPFEISPTLGLMMVGGIWGVSRLRKSRKS